MNDIVTEVIDGRRAVYGEPTNTFPRIAEVWSGIKGVHFDATDVPLMLMGLKLVRTQVCPDYSDNSDDIEGFLAIFRELVGEDMVHARLVSEYLELKDPVTEGQLNVVPPYVVCVHCQEPESLHSQLDKSCVRGGYSEFSFEPETDPGR